MYAQQIIVKRCYHAEREDRICHGPLLLGQLELVVRPKVEICRRCRQAEEEFYATYDKGHSSPADLETDEGLRERQ